MKSRDMYTGELNSYSTSEIQRRFLSIVVNDEFVQTTVDVILKSAATEKVGDGKIFITPVEEACWNNRIISGIIIVFVR